MIQMPKLEAPKLVTEVTSTCPTKTLFKRLFSKLTPTQAQLLSGIKFPCC